MMLIPPPPPRNHEELVAQIKQLEKDNANWALWNAVIVGSGTVGLVIMMILTFINSH